MRFVLPRGMTLGDMQAHADKFDAFAAQRVLCTREGGFDIRRPEATEADVRELALVDAKRYIEHMAQIGVLVMERVG